ncbi:MAG: HNH endonuclease signature motif containing protein [Gilvibacter sp.]
MYFWVNQGKTYKEEKEGSYLWAPVKNSSGDTFFHWKNMIKLKPGDIVFNYRKGFVLGFCEIKSDYFYSRQPEEFNVDVQWEDKGYMILADYVLFSSPLDVNTVFKKVQQFLPKKYSPLNNSGDLLKVKANQGYLYQINAKIAEELFNLSNIRFDQNTMTREEAEDYSAHKETSKVSLTTLRVGQAEFRQKLLRRWNYKCAVNGSSIKEVLIASHIVPWREATNKERMDVENGILLSPIYDALFDKYLISFNEQGGIEISQELQESEYRKLGITGYEKIRDLTDENKKYLKIHMAKLYKL